jgi:fucose permease
VLPAENLRPSRALVALAFAGFVSLGLPDALLGVAWPSLRDAFGRAQGSFGQLLLAGGAGYFATSFFGGRLVGRLGIGGVLASSTALVAVGALAYASSPAWGAALAAAAAVGLGSGAVDAGLNAYAADRFSARQMNWMHACYSAGAMAGPAVMTAVLESGRSWRSGYALIAGLMAALAALFAATRLRWGTSTPPAAPRGTRPPVPARAVLQAVVFFVYTGLEVAAGQWAFTLLTEGRGVDRAWAGGAVSAYWASFVAGRLGFGAVADRVDLDRLLRGGLAAAAAGAALLAATRSFGAGLAGLVLLGLALSPIFPCLMARTPARLGAALAPHAVGWQVSAAMVGAAAVPGLAGLAAGAWGLEAVALVVLAAAVLLFGLHEALLKC